MNRFNTSIEDGKQREKQTLTLWQVAYQPVSPEFQFQVEFVDLNSGKIEKNQTMSFKMPNVDTAYSVWGGKWKLPIIFYLFRNKKDRNYFLQIKRGIPGISAKMLTKELRSLEMNRLVKRTVHDTRPVTVEYSITAHGKTLIPLAEALIKYGQEHRKVMDSK